jgi:hypothetical protein
MFGCLVCAVPWHTPAASKKIKAAIGAVAHLRRFEIKFIRISLDFVSS